MSNLFISSHGADHVHVTVRQIAQLLSDIDTEFFAPAKVKPVVQPVLRCPECQSMNLERLLLKGKVHCRECDTVAGMIAVDHGSELRLGFDWIPNE